MSVHAHTHSLTHSHARMAGTQTCVQRACTRACMALQRVASHTMSMHYTCVGVACSTYTDRAPSHIPVHRMRTCITHITHITHLTYNAYNTSPQSNAARNIMTQHNTICIISQVEHNNMPRRKHTLLSYSIACYEHDVTCHYLTRQHRTRRDMIRHVTT